MIGYGTKIHDTGIGFSMHNINAVSALSSTARRLSIQLPSQLHREDRWAVRCTICENRRTALGRIGNLGRQGWKPPGRSDASKSSRTVLSGYDYKILNARTRQGKNTTSHCVCVRVHSCYFNAGNKHQQWSESPKRQQRKLNKCAALQHKLPVEEETVAVISLRTPPDTSISMVSEYWRWLRSSVELSRNSPVCGSISSKLPSLPRTILQPQQQQHLTTVGILRIGRDSSDEWSARGSDDG